MQLTQKPNYICIDIFDSDHKNITEEKIKFVGMRSEKLAL